MYNLASELENIRKQLVMSPYADPYQSQIQSLSNDINVIHEALQTPSSNPFASYPGMAPTFAPNPMAYRVQSLNDKVQNVKSSLGIQDPMTEHLSGLKQALQASNTQSHMQGLRDALKDGTVNLAASGQTAAAVAMPKVEPVFATAPPLVVAVPVPQATPAAQANPTASHDLAQHLTALKDMVGGLSAAVAQKQTATQPLPSPSTGASAQPASAARPAIPKVPAQVQQNIHQHLKALKDLLPAR